MKKSKYLFGLALVVLITAAFLLVTGSPVLTVAISENAYIPAGTLITWAGIIALPAAIYLGLKKLSQPITPWDKFMARALQVLIVIALLWAPVCYLLAGNFSFSFTEKAEFQGGQSAMRLFWYFSYAMVGVPVSLLAVHGLRGLFLKLKLFSGKNKS